MARETAALWSDNEQAAPDARLPLLVSVLADAAIWLSAPPERAGDMQTLRPVMATAALTVVRLGGGDLRRVSAIPGEQQLWG